MGGKGTCVTLPTLEIKNKTNGSEDFSLRMGAGTAWAPYGAAELCPW